VYILGVSNVLGVLDASGASGVSDVSGISGESGVSCVHSSKDDCSAMICELMSRTGNRNGVVMGTCAFRFPVPVPIWTDSQGLNSVPIKQPRGKDVFPAQEYLVYKVYQVYQVYQVHQVYQVKQVFQVSQVS
jgi:hypothetical protein